MKSSLPVVVSMTALSFVQADESQDSHVEEKEDAAALAEAWAHIVKPKDGPVRKVKEHKGHKTTVTIFSENGDIRAAKRSQFRIDRTARVQIFTFFNNVITAGPGKGQSEPEATSYIYRIEGNTFREVNGMLVGDKSMPIAFSWKRVTD